MVQELLADLQRHLNETRGLEAVAKWSLPSELWAAKQLSCWKKHLEFPLAEATPWSPVSRCFMLWQVANSLHWSRRAGEIAFVRDQPRSTDKEAFGKDAKARLAKIQRQERLRKRTADSWTLLSVTQSMTDEKRKVGKLQERFFFQRCVLNLSNLNITGHLCLSAPLRSLVLGGLLVFLATIEPDWIFIDTDSNSECMNASTRISTSIQTKIRRAWLAANTTVATILKRAFFFRRYMHNYVHAWNA